MASKLDGVPSRRLLSAWLLASFVLSASRDPSLLAIAGVLAALVFRAGVAKSLARTVRSVLPITAGLSLLSLVFLRAATGSWPSLAPFAALALRTSVIGFLTFSVLDRVDLLRALQPFPTLSWLLVVTLAQIHALRLLSTESLQGLRSRMPKKPGLLKLVRGAGGITAALFVLSTRNARDIADAMRSRGF